MTDSAVFSEKAPMKAINALAIKIIMYKLLTFLGDNLFIYSDPSNHIYPTEFRVNAAFYIFPTQRMPNC